METIMRIATSILWSSFEKKTFDAYMDLKIFLESLFGRPVDLVLADAIKPKLRGPIPEDAVHAPGL